MPAQKKATAAKRGPANGGGESLNFTALVDSIRQVHEQSAALVNRTVNTTLTLRNWLIGAYIREYEQRGADRAKYGDALIVRVADRLGATGLNDLTARYLRLCRQFAAVYPEIWRSVTAKSAQALLPNPIWRSLTAESSTVLNEPIQKSAISESERPILPGSIFRSLTEKFLVARETAIRESLTPELGAPVDKLLTSLSFTHLAELVAIDDPLKRTFYEVECIRGNWSVRALKRQIATLYFERSGLSPFEPETVAVRAGRLMLEEMNSRVRCRQSFAFETTLSGRAYARKIREWQEAGYHVKLVFLGLPNADVAVARVAGRVAQGGHNVPENVIRRRFSLGLSNFENIYRPLVDAWILYDNSGGIPVLLKWGEKT